MNFKFTRKFDNSNGLKIFEQISFFKNSLWLQTSGFEKSPFFLARNEMSRKDEKFFDESLSDSARHLGLPLFIEMKYLTQ